MLVFSSVQLWIFIWVLQESLGSDVLTAEHSQTFFLDMYYLIKVGILIEYCIAAVLLNNYYLLVKIQVHEWPCKKFGKEWIWDLKLYL